ncbi:Bug family tripartite tricarboxylate transporter substrate binding protein [Acidovorax sp.]|uniref:Bug family tripartite tricarboxylate transporter substrate binding protein n=1 Tax=Acidovorax sp. TaxID=1872122 RepID=UPI003BAF0745
MIDTTTRRRLLAAAALASLAAAWSGTALAQDWKPTKPITIIVPFPPGGGSDVLIRAVERGLSQRLGRPVVIENRTGASGAIGTEFAWRAAPDGYTLLVGSLDAHSMAPQLRKVPFDATKLVPVAGMASMGYVLMGRSDLPANNLAELIALGKTKELTYGSGGAGSSLHVFTELFARETDTKLLHVPFQGAGPGVLAVLGGQVDLMMVPIAVAPQHRGRLKAFGITPAQRVDSLKDVPTLSEQGVKVAGASWIGVLAPPGLPANIGNTVGAAIREVVASAEFQPRLREIGMQPIQMTQPEFAKFYLDEYKKWGDVIRAAHITVD